MYEICDVANILRDNSTDNSIGGAWENGYCESINIKMRDSFRNGKRFDTMREVEALTEIGGRDYKIERLLSTIGYRPSAPSVNRSITNIKFGAEIGGRPLRLHAHNRSVRGRTSD